MKTDLSQINSAKEIIKIYIIMQYKLYILILVLRKRYGPLNFSPMDSIPIRRKMIDMIKEFVCLMNIIPKYKSSMQTLTYFIAPC
jgi:hypothetical protein